MCCSFERKKRRGKSCGIDEVCLLILNDPNGYVKYILMRIGPQVFAEV